MEDEWDREEDDEKADKLKVELKKKKG